MIKENNPNYKGLWAKYKKYEIVKIDNEYYIRPDKKADYEIYNIFDKEKELLVDFLLIGMEAMNYADINDANCDLMSTEKKYQDMLLDFVNKYGMFGELTYRLINSHIISSSKALTQGYSNIDEMSASTYIKPYFIGNDDIQRIDFDHGLNPDILKYVYGNNNPNGDLAHSFDKGEDFSIVFSKCYTEKIANILVMSRALYRIFNSVENNNWTENEDKKAIYQKYANMFNPNNVAFSFNFENNKTYLNWNFNSLFQAIELILAFNETNERKEVKMCKHCLKPFIAKNLKSDYDTASCRNVANVYRNRAKNK